jgi:hypothetical protein
VTNISIILSLVLVTIDGVLVWIIGFIDTLSTVLRTRGNYSAMADLHTLDFTDAQALGFSVVISRILATDLSQSHYNLKSQMMSSLYSLIHFLPFLFNHFPVI